MKGCIAYIRETDIYNDSRAMKEILALEKSGYHILVFGWNRHGKAKEGCLKIFQNKNISFFFFDCLIEDGLGIKNIFKFLSFFRWVYKKLKELKNDIDFVHACDLTAGHSAYKFCRKYKKKLIYDIFDYYVDSHSIPKLLQGIVERREIKIINYADATIICTEERKEQIAKAKPKNLYVIYNSPDIGEIDFQVGEIDYVYCGVFSNARLIEEIVEEYKNHSNYHICFVGMGRLKDKIQETAEQFEQFKYLGSLSYDEVLKLEAKSKVISAIYKPTLRNHRLCAPNKFYEALALGKPLIVCRGTGIDRVVEEQKIGIVINYDAKEFFEALERLTSDPTTCQEMGKRARALYEKEYKWSLMEDRLTKIYETL